MRNSLWYKRIPTLFGLLLLGIGVITLNYAVNHGVFFLIKASPTYTPEEIRITNVSDTAFTVSFVTKDRVLGSLSYGTSPGGGKIALDDRDQQSGNPQPYFMHHITVKNLTPDTTYYFSITSSNKTFLDNDKPFTIRTLPVLTENPTKQQPIVGTVSYPDGTKDNNVIVFLVSDNAQTLSVLTKSDGSFVMPLNAIRSKGKDSYVSFASNSIIKLLAVSPNAKATVSVLPAQINPVPPITLNNSYDFTQSGQLTPTSIASDSADTTSFPSFSATEASPPKPNIINPSNEETFSDRQPEFEGTAIPNSEVEIEIHSDTAVTTTVTANKNGTWKFRPDTQLAPGEHTITIRTKDRNGILQTITRSFTVFAEGSQFTEPSVSPSPKETSPTPSKVTPTPTATPTATPTLTPTPTATTVPERPTDILTQAVSPPAESPGSSLALLSGIIAAITLSTGVFLLFLGKNNSL